MNLKEDITLSYAKKGFNFSDIQRIKSGKEADVYRVTSSGTLYALKIYKDLKERAFQNDSMYLEGKFYKQPSIRKAVSMKTDFGKKFAHKRWVQREYALLQKLYEKKAHIPQVFALVENTILMQYIGTEEYPAPRLADIEISERLQKKVLSEIVDCIIIFIKNGIVHGDLSPYNILWHEEKMYIIDFPQAVDMRNNPNANTLLKHDVEMVLAYFKDSNIDGEDIQKKIEDILHETKMSI